MTEQLKYVDFRGIRYFKANKMKTKQLFSHIYNERI